MTTPPTTTDMPADDCDQTVPVEFAGSPISVTRISTEMTDGPDLDIAVAHACSLKVYFLKCDAMAESEPGVPSFWRQPDGIWCVNGDDLINERKWSPSTNISDAFEALGVMRGRFALNNLVHVIAADVWEAELISWETPVVLIGAREKTPELAICSAIVRAVNGDK